MTYTGSELLSKIRIFDYIEIFYNRQRNINYYLFLGSSDHLDLRLDRAGKKIEVLVPRYLYETIQAEKEIPVPELPWKIMEGNIGYIDMGWLTPEDVDAASLH